MKTAIELIAIERNEKQIAKHGFTAEHHANNPKWYDRNQLIEAASTLSTKEIKSGLLLLILNTVISQLIKHSNCIGHNVKHCSCY